MIRLSELKLPLTALPVIALRDADAPAETDADRAPAPHPIAALRQLNSLARRLRGGGGNGGPDRRSDQQPSEHLFHYAILQFRSRALEKASRDDESLVTGGKMIGG